MGKHYLEITERQNEAEGLGNVVAHQVDRLRQTALPSEVKVRPRFSGNQTIKN